MVILGIDPGTNRIGFGAIKKDGGRWRHLKSGLIEIASNENKSATLPIIEEKITKVLDSIHPDRVGVEKVFFSKNQKTAIEVAQARGVIVNAILKRGITLFEVTPSEVKLATTGDGRASKKAVAEMLARTIDYKQKKQADDITDALAIAVTISARRVFS